VEADQYGQGEAWSGPGTLRVGLGGHDTDEILAGPGWPDMIDPVDGGTVIAAAEKGPTSRLDRFVGCEGFAS
jgi:hypothetical protein